MPLTLNQFLLLVLTFTAVVVAVFLIRFLTQLRSAAGEGEKTMAEFRKLIAGLGELDGLIKARVVELGELMEASRRTASHVADASYILSTRVISPGSRYWRLIFPIAAFMWRKLRKRKEKKDG